MSDRKRIYIAAPYTRGDVAMNVRGAMAAANDLWKMGFVPFLPHLAHFWHLIFPRPYESWLEYDNEWLPLCHAVLRLPGPSNGADREVALAESLGIPVFTSMFDLTEWGRL